MEIVEIKNEIEDLKKLNAEENEKINKVNLKRFLKLLILACKITKENQMQILLKT